MKNRMASRLLMPRFRRAVAPPARLWRHGGNDADPHGLGEGVHLSEGGEVVPGEVTVSKR